MKCPRCQAGIVAAPDQGSTIVCPGCGARLRPRSPAFTGAAEPRTEPPVIGSIAPSANPYMTLPPGTPLYPIPGPAPATRAATAAAPVPSPGEAPTLEAVLAEMRALRTVQEEILELLRRPAPPAAAPRARAAPADAWDGAGPGSQDVPVRARRRKTVLLIDDDPQTRESALRALEAAEVPVRSVLDGNAGLAAIAEQKPDVIVMELAMGGAMAGKDVVNLIKATMEWVDIPIVLWTRVAIENLREARQTHGADEYVPKASGVEALVARVISVFRRA